MHFKVFVLLCLLVIASYGQRSPYGNDPNPTRFFQNRQLFVPAFSHVAAAIERRNRQSFDVMHPQEEARFFYTTYTLTLTTSTTYSTTYATSTCTTSLASLSECSAGRRRRANNLSMASRRGLFYDEEDSDDLESIFIFPPQSRQDPITVLTPESNESAPDEMDLVQPGLQTLDYSIAGRQGRFCCFTFKFNPSTVTRTSTSTVVLVATCKSSTTFQTCPSFGKELSPTPE